jgi:hypothetical protein
MLFFSFPNKHHFDKFLLLKTPHRITYNWQQNFDSKASYLQT